MGRQPRKKRRQQVQKELARRQQQAVMARGGQIQQGQQQQAVHTSTEIRQERYSGPLPPPKVMAEYEANFPGSAERIFKQMEIEADHRRALEVDESQHMRGTIDVQFKQKGRGQWMGLVIGLGGLLVVWQAMVHGHPWAGAAVFFAQIGALATVFVTGTRAPSQSPEDAPKTKDIAKREG